MRVRMRIYRNRVGDTGKECAYHMDKKQKFCVKGVKTASLETRLDNARKLEVTDFRSVEAKIRRIGSETLEKYFFYDDRDYEAFRQSCARIGENITPQSSYMKACTAVRKCARMGRCNDAIEMMRLLLTPIRNMGGKYQWASDPDQGKEQDESLKGKDYPVRTFYIFLPDYIKVLDQMFPGQKQDYDWFYRKHIRSEPWWKGGVPCLLEVAYVEMKISEKAEEAIDGEPLFDYLWKPREPIDWTDEKEYANEKDPAIREAFKGRWWRILDKLLIEPYTLMERSCRQNTGSISGQAH